MLALSLTLEGQCCKQYFFLKGTFKNLCQAIEASFSFHQYLSLVRQQKLKIKLEDKIQTLISLSSLPLCLEKMEKQNIFFLEIEEKDYLFCHYFT